MKNDYGLIFWAHLIVVLTVYLSWFLLDWRLIGLVVILYYLQLLILGNCVLTTLQFKGKNRDTTFYWYYLDKMGLKFSKTKVRLVVDFIIPPLLILIAVTYQLILNNSPVITL